MRSLLLAALGAIAIWYYANEFGLKVGYPPFTPVYYWDYTGTIRQTLWVGAPRGFIAIRLNGKLEQGSLEVIINRPENSQVQLQKRYTKVFTDDTKVPLQPGYYDVTFKLINTRGNIRYDWFSARNEFN